MEHASALFYWTVMEIRRGKKLHNKPETIENSGLGKDIAHCVTMCNDSLRQPNFEKKESPARKTNDLERRLREFGLKRTKPHAPTPLLLIPATRLQIWGNGPCRGVMSFFRGETAASSQRTDWSGSQRTASTFISPT